MFTDRRDAGRQLAERLLDYDSQEPVVIAMPRGGVVVAAEVADHLDAPLDVMVVRKIGCPWQPELGIGAIAEGDVRILNDALISETGVGPQALERATEQERTELARRVRRYRRDRPPISVEGRVVILVDDGIATGFTARAAMEALRSKGAHRVVLAVPVAPQGGLEAMRSVADEVVVLEVPPWFFAIGDFYEDFAQTSDEIVIALLDQAATRSGRGAKASGEPDPRVGHRRTSAHLETDPTQR